MPRNLSVTERAMQEDWYKRASNPLTPTLNNQTVRTAVEYMDETETVIGLFPTVRLIDGELKKLPVGQAREMAISRGDYVKVDSFDEGIAASKTLSSKINTERTPDGYTARWNKARRNK
jgi:hypothetical protein